MVLPVRSVSLLSVILFVLHKLAAGNIETTPNPVGILFSSNSSVFVSDSGNVSNNSISIAGHSEPAGLANNFIPQQSVPVDYYKTKYDSIDVETILNNPRMVKNYAKCMLNEGPCTPDGLEFKRILPDAIRTNCLRCTEKQKAVTVRAVKRLMKEYPKAWAQLSKAWDPKDIFVKKFLTTYSNWEYHPPQTTETIIFDRFGGDDDKTNTSPNKQITSSSTKPTNVLFNIPPLPSISPAVLDKVEPLANEIGASLTATVSFGNIVNNVIKGIGAVGNRVIETGAQIANVVVKSFSRPL